MVFFSLFSECILQPVKEYPRLGMFRQAEKIVYLLKCFFFFYRHSSLWHHRPNSELFFRVKKRSDGVANRTGQVFFYRTVIKRDNCNKKDGCTQNHLATVFFLQSVKNFLLSFCHKYRILKNSHIVLCIASKMTLR